MFFIFYVIYRQKIKFVELIFFLNVKQQNGGNVKYLFNFNVMAKNNEALESGIGMEI